MNRCTHTALLFGLLASIAHGANTLDWTSNSWFNGSVTGTYNSMSGAGATNSVINPLTYDFGGGLTATLTATLTGGAQWQNGSTVYGGWAPRTGNDVFAFGIQQGSATTGATLSLTFNKAVSLDSFVIGDIDSGGSVQDGVTVSTSSATPLSVLATPAVSAPTFSTNGGALVFSGIAGNEGNFSATAPTAWAELSSGSSFVTNLTISLLNGTGNHGIWISDITVTPQLIPEPSTYALLLGAGTLGLALWRRRRRA